MMASQQDAQVYWPSQHSACPRPTGPEQQNSKVRTPSQQLRGASMAFRDRGVRAAAGSPSAQAPPPPEGPARLEHALPPAAEVF